MVIFCSVFTAVLVALSTRSTYSAHVWGESHGVSPLCAMAGGAFSQGLEAAALLAFRGS